MGKLRHSDITQEILGASFEVHGRLGPGFLESIYERAMVHELTLRQLRVQSQEEVIVDYKGVRVGKHVLDLVVEETVVVELKAIEGLADIHTAVAISYLAATQLPVALILNFGKPSLEYKRIVR